MGENAVLEIRSESMRSAPPDTTDSGMSLRWSVPNIPLNIFGTISPIKPMIPDTYTLLPVSNAMRIKRIVLVKTTFTPSEVASCSPNM